MNKEESREQRRIERTKKNRENKEESREQRRIAKKNRDYRFQERKIKT